MHSQEEVPTDDMSCKYHLAPVVYRFRYADGKELSFHRPVGTMAMAASQEFVKLAGQAMNIKDVKVHWIR